MTQTQQFFKKATEKAKQIYKNRPEETKSTVVGTAVGAVVGGVCLGGMGLALLGTAIPVSGTLAVGAIGAMIGNRYGIGKDKNAGDKMADKPVKKTKAERDAEMMAEFLKETPTKKAPPSV